MTPPFPILFEDNHLIAIVKPAGIPTQDPPFGGESATSLLKEYRKQREQKSGGVFCEAVHRIDKPTSGIVLFAKSKKGLSRMMEAQRMQLLTKTYVCMIEGNLPDDAGTLEHFLLHSDHRALVSNAEDPKAKRALLSYRTLSHEARGTRVEVALHTGRYHQIRAQMEALGCPIIGDVRYGSSYPLPQGHILLHHAKLIFPHPTTKETLVLHSMPPW